MPPLHELGKFLIFIGILTALLGVLLLVGSGIPWLGRLPGDIVIRREKFTFFFPLGSCILISIVLTLLLWLFRK